MSKNKAIIIGSIIVVVTIIVVFYILNSGKTNSSFSSNANQTLVASEKQPSKTLREYSDDTGFSFQYPSDVQVNKKDTTNDSTAYANLEIIGKTKGGISVKVLDTKLKNIDDWFLENNYTSTKAIKIGKISGKEANMTSKIIGATLDQGVLFVIEVDTQGQKYWENVYGTILSSFSFVSQGENTSTGAQSLDNSGDAILEEETIE